MKWFSWNEENRNKKIMRNKMKNNSSFFNNQFLSEEKMKWKIMVVLSFYFHHFQNNTPSLFFVTISPLNFSPFFLFCFHSTCTSKLCFHSFLPFFLLFWGRSEVWKKKLKKKKMLFQHLFCLSILFFCNLYFLLPLFEEEWRYE